MLATYFVKFFKRIISVSLRNVDSLTSIRMTLREEFYNYFKDLKSFCFDLS